MQCFLYMLLRPRYQIAADTALTAAADTPDAVAAAVSFQCLRSGLR